MVLSPKMPTLLAATVATVSSGALEPPPVVVTCSNPYALCAYANCTVNPDNATASCGCYSFLQPGDNMVRIGLIPDETVKAETLSICNTSESCDVDDAPVCASLDGSGGADGLWPTADLVSTYSRRLEAENGVLLEEDNETYSNATWRCPAAPGRYVAVFCMLAPCKVFSPPDANPYNYGTHNATCTCPLVEADVAYDVYGGLQDPCSTEIASVGEHVQAAGGAILAKFEANSSQVDEAWAGVRAAFDGNAGESSDSVNSSDTRSTGGETTFSGTAMTNAPSIAAFGLAMCFVAAFV